MLPSIQDLFDRFDQKEDLLNFSEFNSGYTFNYQYENYENNMQPPPYNPNYEPENNFNYQSIGNGYMQYINN